VVALVVLVVAHVRAVAGGRGAVGVHRSGHGGRHGMSDIRLFSFSGNAAIERCSGGWVGSVWLPQHSTIAGEVVMMVLLSRTLMGIEAATSSAGVR
jgi:hypothetical protein